MVAGIRTADWIGNLFGVATYCEGDVKTYYRTKRAQWEAITAALPAKRFHRVVMRPRPGASTGTGQRKRVEHRSGARFQAEVVEATQHALAMRPSSPGHGARKGPAMAGRIRAPRPKVERKIGHLMRRKHGGRRARVRGRDKVAADFSLLAAAVNLARLGALRIAGMARQEWAGATA
jgi:hypothetical protein